MLIIEGLDERTSSGCPFINNRGTRAAAISRFVTELSRRNSRRGFVSVNDEGNVTSVGSLGICIGVKGSVVTTKIIPIY